MCFFVLSIVFLRFDFFLALSLSFAFHSFSLYSFISMPIAAEKWIRRRVFSSISARYSFIVTTLRSLSLARQVRRMMALHIAQVCVFVLWALHPFSIFDESGFMKRALINVCSSKAWRIDSVYYADDDDDNNGNDDDRFELQRLKIVERPTILTRFRCQTLKIISYARHIAWKLNRHHYVVTLAK